MRIAMIAVLSIAASVPAVAAEPAGLRALFPHEADVTVEGDGLSRLVLPPDVLSACKPDLSDLRLFDGDDRELPFVVDVGVPDTEAELAQRYDPAVVEVARRETRRETGPPLRHETYELDMPTTRPHSGRWTLVIDVRHAEFVARVRVADIDGSVFRLGRPPRAEKLRLPLPDHAGGRLRVELESEHASWLDPKFHLVSARTFERGGHVSVPLTIESSRDDDGQSVITLVRPRGIVPDLLRIGTTTTPFDRAVAVWDEGTGRGAGVVGSGRVFRVDGAVPVEEREIRLQPAAGDRLRVTIDDGDSPPLADLRFEAVVRQPALVFSLPEGHAATLRFGGGRAHRPRYDLAGLLPPGGRAAGERARAAAALYDRDALGTARLGAVRLNPSFDRAPALAFAMRPGAELDRRVFRHVRSVQVPETAEGLSVLELNPADLAVLKAELGDLRIAGEDARQWPYLVERGAADRSVALVIDEPRFEDGASHYALSLPVAPLGVDHLVLEVEAPYFDRAYRLTGVTDDDEERTIATGRLRRPIDDPRPVTVDVGTARLKSLELIVEDGDDAPLALRAVEARVRVPKLYLTAPEGEYDLLLGSPDERRPKYELERVRDVVLAVQAAPAGTGDLLDNPDFRLRSRLGGTGTMQRVLLWVALILAVVVLAVLTLRMARG